MTWSDRADGARAFLRAANGLGSRGIEALWASGCAVAGKLRRERVRRWATTGKERVLVIAAHADDEAMGCAGTLIRHRRDGDRVRIVVVTDGRLSRAYGLDPETMAECRKQEATEAAARLGAELEWLGLREGNWSGQTLDQELRRLLAEVAPTIIYAPSAIDYHPEHRRVAEILASILANPDVGGEVRIYGIQVPLTPLLINLVHDVSDLEQPIRHALAAYATQRVTVSTTFRLRRYAARSYGGDTQMEAFCSTSTGHYASLHDRPTASFRPLHPRAWTDPLAMAVGWSERMSWRRLLLREPREGPDRI